MKYILCYCLILVSLSSQEFDLYKHYEKNGAEFLGPGIINARLPSLTKYYSAFILKHKDLKKNSLDACLEAADSFRLVEFLTLNKINLAKQKEFVTWFVEDKRYSIFLSLLTREDNEKKAFGILRELYEKDKENAGRDF